MNVALALDTKARLRVVIDAYEAFLYKEIRNAGPKAIVSTEALNARDAVRTVGMSEVSVKRVDKIVTQNKTATEAQAGGIVSQSQALSVNGISGISGIGPTTYPGPPRTPSDSLFRNLKDCIPCNHLWEWPDFDWDRLKDILKLDLETRFSWLLDWEKLLDENFVLEGLCSILALFKGICPQDLAALITLLIAYISNLIAGLKFNFEGILKDILGMILKPYIEGLEDFLTAYIQFIISQINCVLNALQVSAEAIRDANISNDLGPDAIKFNVDIFGEKTKDDAQNVVDGIKYTQNFLAHKPREAIKALVIDVPAWLISKIKIATSVVEKWVKDLQDTVIEFLGGEWLVTRNNIGLLQTKRAISTIIQIMRIVMDLGAGKELCSEDNIKKVIDILNDRNPDVIVIEDLGQPSPSGSNPFTPPGSETPSTGSGGSAPNGNEGGRSSNQQNNQSSNAPTSATRNISFSIHKCLKDDGSVAREMMSRWESELS
jgi:hypothetical protein